MNARKYRKQAKRTLPADTENLLVWRKKSDRSWLLYNLVMQMLIGHIGVNFSESMTLKAVSLYNI